MTFSDQLQSLGSSRGELQVRLSTQLIHLLSEQMYSSPIKAIEELVVNAYDADANKCCIGFEKNENLEDNTIVIFDNGSGMDYHGLEQLWHVGESPKIDEDVSPRYGRRVIGKFGIGKLATYAIANKITYLSRHENGLFHVSCDFRSFKSSTSGGASEAVLLDVREVSDINALLSSEELRSVCELLQLTANELIESSSWTICVLEALKEKASDLKLGRLKWVLKTAMPLKLNFEVFVDKDKIERTPEDFNPIVEFSVSDIGKDRLTTLNQNKSTKYPWTVSGSKLFSDLFPSGVFGNVVITKRSLVVGKSAEIGRSHGFFVYVRERLVNQEDELFGLHALSHATFNFFRADVYADDLHTDVTAPREGIEHGERRNAISGLLLATFNEARQRQDAIEKDVEEKEKRKREDERNFVSTRLVDQPIANSIVMTSTDEAGTDADEGWFFLKEIDHKERKAVVENLYSSSTRKYRFSYDQLGRADRMVKLDPGSGEFTLNDDHEVVIAHSDDPRAKQLLEDMVASEVLLEVYLREAGINPHIIGAVLERRDLLMRSLAQDRVYSLDSIAKFLLDARDDEYNLEIAVVAASRALGFNAKHIGGPGKPDGIARFNDYREEEKKITLEAKSSQGIPALSSFDFAGLAQHCQDSNAHGCLLVAPDYPGNKGKKANSKKLSKSSVDKRAAADKISCWTIDDLVSVVRATEIQQITASQILDIVLNKFKPSEVKEAVQDLLNVDNMQQYYREILGALRELGMPGRLEESTRTVQHVTGILAGKNAIPGMTDKKIRRALVQMSNTSKGMVKVTGDRIIFLGDIEEFARRISSLTGISGNPRKLGNFRHDKNSSNDI